MTGIVCAIVGNFSTAVAAQIIRLKKGITAVGNAQIDTAQSKFGGASALFDGTGDALATAGIAFGTGDFTVEYWIRSTSLSGYDIHWDLRGTPTSNLSPIVYTNNGVLYMDVGATTVITGSTLSTNTWYHIALSRSGSSTKLFVDGTQSGSTYTDTNNYVSAATLYIGELYSLGGNGVVGHMDEIRISNTARYTANFTAPTTAFVNDDNTLLLIHADGTDASTFFEDDNGLTPFSTRTAKTLTAYGNAQVDTAQYKYGSSALLCDGNGDYVLASDNADFAFGTSSFTIEYWIRFNAINTLYVPICSRAGTGVGVGDWWCEITAAENKMYWGFRNVAGTQYYVNLALAGTAFATGQWYHIALVNNAGTAQMYVNGTATGATTSLSGSFGGGSGGTQGVAVGALGQGSYSVNGWIDEVRISKTARYTANFTPTGPYNSDSNTVLLMHMEGTDASTTFTDDVFGVRTQKGIQALGNAQIDTAQSKFGGASALFDGTGDYLIVQSNPIPTSGSFTVEFWIRFSSLGVLRPIWSNRDTGGTNRGVLYISSANTITWWNGGDNLNHTSTLSANTWYHIACVKDGSTRRLLVDGAGMVTDSAIYTAGDLFQIGRADYTSTAFTSEIAGHIDEFRVSNTARYTTTFTPSTTPFVNDDNTLLLMHCDGTDAATVFRDDNGARAPKGITAVGNAQIDTAQSKFGGASALFDGNDKLYHPYTTDFNFQGDFTIEFWCRLVSNDGAFRGAIYNNWGATGGLSGWYVATNAFNGTQKFGFSFITNSGSKVEINYGSTLPLNTWMHLAVCRDGNKLYFYKDGVLLNSGGYTLTEGLRGFTGNNDFTIGNEINGWMDEIRISNSARYPGGTTFTPSTAPFQNDANTVLLLHMDGTDGSTVFFDDNGIAPYTP